uniref:Thr-rich antifreeze protein isoform 3kDaFL n=1 Tax=Campaea perlata TaxID=82598 RepID=F5C099_CAMPR|nr:Thr-rich antifreeze protein isoform 3kDaFL precursor [Campaea perlata]
MWIQAAILLCSSLHIGYAEKGYLTINDVQVPMTEVQTESKSGKDDYNTLGYYHYYDGERVRIACPKGSDLSDSSELTFVNGAESHRCFKPNYEADDLSTRNFYVKLTEDSNGAYAECTVKGPWEHLRSRVYFLLQNLPTEGALYFSVNGVAIPPVTGQEGEELHTHYDLEYGYDSQEPLEIASIKDSNEYGPMECVLSGENIPSELNDLKSKSRKDNVHFLATLQDQHVSLDCSVEVKSTLVRHNRMITISLALKPFNSYFAVRDLVIESASTKDILFYENCGGSFLNDHKITYEYKENRNVSMKFSLKGHQNKEYSSEFPFTGAISAFSGDKVAIISTTLVDHKTAGRATATATATADTTRTATATATSSRKALTTARLALVQGKTRLFFNALW